MNKVAFNVIVENDTKQDLTMVSRNLGARYPGVKFIMVDAGHSDMDDSSITIYGENLLNADEEARFVKSMIHSVQGDARKTLTPNKTFKLLDYSVHDMKNLVSKRKIEGAKVKVHSRNWGKQGNPLKK